MHETDTHIKREHSKSIIPEAYRQSIKRIIKQMEKYNKKQKKTHIYLQLMGFFFWSYTIVLH